jgi:hypothetical protein
VGVTSKVLLVRMAARIALEIPGPFPGAVGAWRIFRLRCPRFRSIHTFWSGERPASMAGRFKSGGVSEVLEKIL